MKNPLPPLRSTLPPSAIKVSRLACNKDGQCSEAYVPFAIYRGPPGLLSDSECAGKDTESSLTHYFSIWSYSRRQIEKEKQQSLFSPFPFSAYSIPFAIYRKAFPRAHELLLVDTEKMLGLVAGLVGYATSIQYPFCILSLLLDPSSPGKVPCSSLPCFLHWASLLLHI